MQQFYGRLGKYQQTVLPGAQKAWRAFKRNYKLDFPIMNEAGVQCAVQVCNIGKMRIQQKTVNLGLFQTYTHNKQKSRAIRYHKSTQTAAPSQALWHFLTSSDALII